MSKLRRFRRPGLAYIVHSLAPGGTERLAIDMSLAFSSEFDVLVICLDEPGQWAAGLRYAGIPVHCVWRQPGLDLSVALKIARICRSAQCMVIHAHQCTPWFYAALSRVFHSTPRLLLEEHGRFYPEPDSRRRRMINRLLIGRLTHRFVAVSYDVKERLERYEGIRSKVIDVIYNGSRQCDTLEETERLERRAEFGFESDHFVIGTVGRLDPIKNLPMLIDAMAKAAERIPNLRGLIVGDGPEAANLASKLDQMDLGETVKLSGYRPDASRLTECMDVFVLPSLSEGISMALLEAVAASVPVIVTDVGGNPEVVLSDVTGIVVPSDNATELASAIFRSAKEREEAALMAQAGLQRFLATFSFDAMLASYRQVYYDLISMNHVEQEVR